jgi:hypothetical protein
VTVLAVQVPAPLQRGAERSTPCSQYARPQVVSTPGNTQESSVDPSHVPSQSAKPPQRGRLPRGRPVTATHAPSWPGSSQAAQMPLQAFSQQIPSTQNPLAHC